MTGAKRGVQQKWRRMETRRGSWEGKRGGGEGYYDREMILDKWSNKIFSERASELAGRKSSWETGDAARELWCNGVFVEKQTGSVGKICGAGINRVFAPRSE